MTLRTIDFHTHTHPTAEAGVAFQRLWGHDAPERNGTPAELRRATGADDLEDAFMAATERNPG